jgi:peptidyl-prolyl cis-trans isomerase D
MAGATDTRKRILLGVVVLALGGSMLLYLVPQTPGTGEVSTDTVAKIGDQSVSLQEVRDEVNEYERQRQIPKFFESRLALEFLQQLVFQKEIEYEAKRLGITVSDQERADRIRLFVPTAFNGGTFVGMDRYTAEVQARFQLPVAEFEKKISQGLLEEKFRKLVTDGISVGPAELQDEFRNKNEKVKLDYTFIKPEDLQAKITPDDAEIKASFEKNRSKYQVPEKRVVRYGLVDVNQIRQTLQVSDDQLKVRYQQNIQQYQVPNRVHVQHILLMTVSKTDAEVDEIKKKAEDILSQVRKGAKFEDIAKKYSEDPGTKDKGGDLGWLVQGQTVPEFEKVAFSLQKGQISDLVKTQYGFHIIKVVDKETAHTKPFEEVKDSLRPELLRDQVDKQASDTSDQISAAIRKSNKTSLDDLANQFKLVIGETHPVGATDPLLELGNSTDVKDAIFRLRAGELSLPIRTDRGYVVLSLKTVLPAHQATLDEVREKIITDLKREKSAEMARSKAEELVKRAKAGEKFDVAAKALGLEPKTSDLLARDGSLPGSAASGKQLSAAFNLSAGSVGTPLNLGQNWLVYRVSEKQEPNPADFEKQKRELTETVLQSKRYLAFEAFKTALESRLKQEGKLKLMPEKLQSFGAPS